MYYVRVCVLFVFPSVCRVMPQMFYINRFVSYISVELCLCVFTCNDNVVVCLIMQFNDCTILSAIQECWFFVVSQQILVVCFVCVE